LPRAALARGIELAGRALVLDPRLERAHQALEDLGRFR
jgi:hypothetical protein